MLPPVYILYSAALLRESKYLLASELCFDINSTWLKQKFSVIIGLQSLEFSSNGITSVYLEWFFTNDRQQLLRLQYEGSFYNEINIFIELHWHLFVVNQKVFNNLGTNYF